MLFDFDPFSGYVLTELNDLHYLLGTSAESPVNMRGDRSRSGVIDEVVQVSNDDAFAFGAPVLDNPVPAGSTGFDPDKL